MESIWAAISSFWHYIVYAVSNIRIPYDIIDILVIAFLIYKAIEFLRESRAGQLVKGVIMLFAIYLIADWWELATLNFVLSRVMDSIIIAAAVIFQPELRRLFEKIGRTNFAPGQLLDGQTSEMEKCIDSVTKAAGNMQDSKTGALIVFERKTQLGEIINTGTVLDAEVSVPMVANVFFPKSPLHDGAVIIRDGRIYAASCILPLTQRDDISDQLGTRHRAAIGMTENSDAVVLVVSEETGNISIVEGGRITRDYNSISAGVELKRLLLTNEADKKENIFARAFNILKPKKKNGKDDAE